MLPERESPHDDVLNYVFAEIRCLASRCIPKIMMLHEQDPERGGCAFDRLIAVTPQELKSMGVYKKIAVALHPASHRAVSTQRCAMKADGGAVGMENYAWWAMVFCVLLQIINSALFCNIRTAGRCKRGLAATLRDLDRVVSSVIGVTSRSLSEPPTTPNVIYNLVEVYFSVGIVESHYYR